VTAPSGGAGERVHPVPAASLRTGDHAHLQPHYVFGHLAGHDPVDVDVIRPPRRMPGGRTCAVDWDGPGNLTGSTVFECTTPVLVDGGAGAGQIAEAARNLAEIADEIAALRRVIFDHKNGR
jgi:hypothetical protein